ncbi:hypothetical protein ARMGADRAFT_1039047 [Armillaria gallica]|uniref:Uncharacterized protein n=1 Tax=Armillaria gallica TaxID=47427 RepID=A0A2H3CFK7_ARMGA|nr:hypothetical protein ARMGADRAFT_1039047 [Armillaria gallica]
MARIPNMRRAAKLCARGAMWYLVSDPRIIYMTLLVPSVVLESDTVKYVDPRQEYRTTFIFHPEVRLHWCKKGDIGRGKGDMYLIPPILVARRSLVPGLPSGTRQKADWIALIFKTMSSNMVLQHTIDRRSEIQGQSGLVENSLLARVPQRRCPGHGDTLAESRKEYTAGVLGSPLSFKSTEEVVDEKTGTRGCRCPSWTADHAKRTVNEGFSGDDGPVKRRGGWWQRERQGRAKPTTYQEFSELANVDWCRLHICVSKRVLIASSISLSTIAGVHTPYLNDEHKYRHRFTYGSGTSKFYP